MPSDVVMRGERDTLLLRLAASSAVFVGVFLSGFVIREPAPYELYMVGLLAIWALFGLRISTGMTPLIVLLVAFNIGGLVAMSQMAELRNAPLYLAVSAFLALTAVFFAVATERQPWLYPVIFTGWVAAAVLTSLFGIAGYFGLFPGAEIFTRYSRAAGVFEDPNVFGAYLITPALFLLHRLLTGRAAMLPVYSAGLGIVGLGLLLSFSRGAWGTFAFSVVVLVATLFLQSANDRFRLRLAMTSLAVVLLLVLLVAAALQIPAVAELFSARAQLLQEYDAARLGRFARHLIGFEMAMEHPLGIGPLVFGRLLGEDTHNIWLKALLDYSWLGFAAYLLLVIWTLAAGLRILLRARPWQPYLLCAWTALLGHVLLGTVIDTDHWRHFYLLMGLVWGAITLERRHQRAPERSAAGARHFAVASGGARH
jgi:O-antigen ligase